MKEDIRYPLGGVRNADSSRFQHYCEKDFGHIYPKWHTHLISFHSLYLGFPTCHRFRSAHLKKTPAPRLKTFATSEEELVEGSRVKGATKTSPGNRKGSNITKTRLIFCEMFINSSYTSWIPPVGVTDLKWTSNDVYIKLIFLWDGIFMRPVVSHKW